MNRLELRKLAGSRQGVKLALVFGRTLPPLFGYAVVDSFAHLLARCKSTAMVKAVRANQLMIRGGNATPGVLDRAVTDVFTHAGRCFIDLYGSLKTPREMERMFPETGALRKLIRISRDKNFGALVVVPHMSNFDLCLLSAAYRGVKTQVLTYGKPTAGYRLQNEIRSATGLDITPVSRAVHKKAVENLRSGGLVTTAIDRPVRGKSQKLNFFGQPASLPAGHIRMALEADVPVIVAAVYMDENGYYRIQCTDPLYMTRFHDQEKEIIHNGERVLQRVEGFIRQHPGQWLMYYPVWSGVSAQEKPFSNDSEEVR